MEDRLQREWRDKIEYVVHASSLDEFLELLRQTVYNMFEQKEGESTLGIASSNAPYRNTPKEPYETYEGGTEWTYL